MKQRYIQSLETESKNIQKSLNSSVKTQEQTKAELDKAKSDAEAKQQQIKALQDEVGKLQAKKQQSLAFLTPTASAAGGGTTEAKILALKMCESGNNYGTATGNGYYGAYQYDVGTWNNYGGYHLPSQAPPEVQDAKFQQTYAARGGSPWPVCSRQAGL